MAYSWVKFKGIWVEVIQPIPRRIFQITPNKHTYDAVHEWGFQVDPENLLLYSDGSMGLRKCVLLKDFRKCVPLPNQFVRAGTTLENVIIIPYYDRVYFGEESIRML